VQCCSHGYRMYSFTSLAGQHGHPQHARRQRLRVRRTHPLRTPTTQHRPNPRHSSPSVDHGPPRQPVWRTRRTSSQCSFRRSSAQRWSPQIIGPMDSGCAANTHRRTDTQTHGHTDTRTHGRGQNPARTQHTKSDSEPLCLAQQLSCPVLSCPVLSCPVLSCTDDVTRCIHSSRPELD
jgi:hypothetical protein